MLRCFVPTDEPADAETPRLDFSPRALSRWSNLYKWRTAAGAIDAIDDGQVKLKMLRRHSSSHPTFMATVRDSSALDGLDPFVGEYVAATCRTVTDPVHLALLLRHASSFPQDLRPLLRVFPKSAAARVRVAEDVMADGGRPPSPLGD